MGRRSASVDCTETSKVDKSTDSKKRLKNADSRNKESTMKQWTSSPVFPSFFDWRTYEEIGIRTQDLLLDSLFVVPACH